MILSLIFILLLLAENIILPALIGPTNSFLIPILAISAVVYDNNTKFRFFQTAIFILIYEFFSGAPLASSLIPFILTIGFYIWLNSLLDIGTGLREGRFLITSLGGIMILSFLIYSYSYLFLLFNQSYGMIRDWQDLIILFKSSIFEVIIESILLGILFKYALKTK